MTKKKRVEQDRVEAVLDDISENVDVYAPEISDQISAYQRQRDSLLYTMDCVLLALAEDVNATFVIFDGELLEEGGVTPADAMS